VPHVTASLSTTSDSSIPLQAVLDWLLVCDEKLTAVQPKLGIVAQALGGAEARVSETASGYSVTRIADPGWIGWKTPREFRALFDAAGFTSSCWIPLLPGFGIAIAQKSADSPRFS
jgi:hypothetical protein